VRCTIDSYSRVGANSRTKDGRTGPARPALPGCSGRRAHSVRIEPPSSHHAARVPRSPKRRSHVGARRMDDLRVDRGSASARRRAACSRSNRRIAAAAVRPLDFTCAQSREVRVPRLRFANETRKGRQVGPSSVLGTEPTTRGAVRTMAGMRNRLRERSQCEALARCLGHSPVAVRRVNELSGAVDGPSVRDLVLALHESQRRPRCQGRGTSPEVVLAS
jgi:hypothetical protein